MYRRDSVSRRASTASMRRERGLVSLSPAPGLSSAIGCVYGKTVLAGLIQVSFRLSVFSYATVCCVGGHGVAQIARRQHRNCVDSASIRLGGLSLSKRSRLRRGPCRAGSAASRTAKPRDLDANRNPSRTRDAIGQTKLGVLASIGRLQRREGQRCPARRWQAERGRIRASVRLDQKPHSQKADKAVHQRP
jgi:hypothetical protein